MSKTVQDRVKTDWEKAQREGGQRAERIRQIVQTAAAEAFGEIKGGSSEVETIGRKSLAEMIEQLKAKEAAEASAAEATAPVEETGDAAPTWAEIFAELRHLANDRKVDWAQGLLASLQTQIDRFDADMAAEYGDRYSPFRPLVRGVRSLIALAYGRVSSPAEAEAPTPVQIEVLEDGDVSATPGAPSGDDSTQG